MSTAVTTTERETTESTYYDPERVLRICSTCEVLSWFALALGIFTLLAAIWVLIQPFLATRVSFSNFMGNGSPLLIVFGLAALICFFFWVFLRAIAEGLYILMDLQEGQRARLKQAEED